MAHPPRRHQPEKTRRMPGGPLPEGWEYFRDCKRPVWLGLPATRDDGAGGLLVFGLLPMKCPLARTFERQLDQKAQAPVTSDEEESASTERSAERGSETREQLRLAERERTSRARFFTRLPVENLNEYITSRLGSSSAARNRGIPPLEVRALINMCATDRYYDPRDLERRGIAFERFFFEGGGKMLTEQQINALLDVILRLADSVGSFYVGRRSKDLPAIIEAESRISPETRLADALPPLPVIGMHCTHGVNRTGYCMLMILFMLGLNSVQEGLDIFHESRGHDLNKLEFAAHLEEVWLDPSTASKYRSIRSRVFRNAAFSL